MRAVAGVIDVVVIVSVSLTFSVTLSLSKGAFADQTCPAPTVTADPHPITIVAPKATLSVRVADTPAVQEYGLMCVRDLPARTGMIFVFPPPDMQRSFWMKNTLIPLDMVFVHRDGRVDSIADNVPATTVATPDAQIPQRIGVGSFVIELNAGEAAHDGIATGSRLDLNTLRKVER